MFVSLIVLFVCNQYLPGSLLKPGTAVSTAHAYASAGNTIARRVNAVLSVRLKRDMVQ